MKKDEFYIGWMPEAPGGFAQHTRRVVIALALFIIGTALIIASRQRKFSTSTFEYGQLTQVTGVYQSYPFPSLKLKTRPDIFGKSSVMTVPLVGYGKSGADDVIRHIEKAMDGKLDNRVVTLKGTLIYHDGKTLLQIDRHDDPLSNAGGIAEHRPLIRQLGEVELTGEILDPKCYFGVMKPGSGKPHRDCAIRCIAGGINPVFYVRNERGQAGYYLLLNEEGGSLKDQVSDHVAEPVSLHAKAVQVDDWIVLYVKTGTIQRTGGISWFKTNDISCGKPQ